jgi:hypothetical protein
MQETARQMKPAAIIPPGPSRQLRQLEIAGFIVESTIKILPDGLTFVRILCLITLLLEFSFQLCFGRLAVLWVWIRVSC